MQRTSGTYTVRLLIALAATSTLIVAQQRPLPPPPPPAASGNVNFQINTDVLNDIVRSAVVFNNMVQGLNLRDAMRSTGVTGEAYDQNGRPIKRTAAVLGAGAGAGAAVGAMTGGQKGAMIGAIAGGAGAVIIDQIAQHHARQVQNPDLPPPGYGPQGYAPHDPEPRQFKQRPPLPPPSRYPQ